VSYLHFIFYSLCFAYYQSNRSADYIDKSIAKLAGATVKLVDCSFHCNKYYNGIYITVSAFEYIDDSGALPYGNPQPIFTAKEAQNWLISFALSRFASLQ